MTVTAVPVGWGGGTDAGTLFAGRSRGTWLWYPGEHSCPPQHHPPGPPKAGQPRRHTPCFGGSRGPGCARAVCHPLSDVAVSTAGLAWSPGQHRAARPPWPPRPRGRYLQPPPDLPLGHSWFPGCHLISAHVSLAGPTGCPRAAGTSGECVVPPYPAAISVGTRGCLGRLRDPRVPAPLLLPAGGEREARRAGQGRRAREGRRGGDAWEDGTLLLTLSCPSRSPTGLSLGCLQLRLRAVLLVPGCARTFRPCRSQGRARGCWSPGAGERRAASKAAGSIPGVPGLG